MLGREEANWRRRIPISPGSFSSPCTELADAGGRKIDEIWDILDFKKTMEVSGKHLKALRRIRGRMRGRGGFAWRPSGRPGERLWRGLGGLWLASQAPSAELKRKINRGMRLRTPNSFGQSCCFSQKCFRVAVSLECLSFVEGKGRNPGSRPPLLFIRFVIKTSFGMAYLTDL